MQKRLRERWKQIEEITFTLSRPLKPNEWGIIPRGGVPKSKFFTLGEFRIS